jgi:Phosphate uptake regulator
MSNSIKNRQFTRLHDSFESLSEKLMAQYGLVEDNFRNLGEAAVEQKLEDNENAIDQLEKDVRVEFVNSILLFSPRAKELRKIITYHDLTNLLEESGDILMYIAQLLKKVDYKIEEFDNLVVFLMKMFAEAKQMMSNALFSFYYEDSSVSYKTIKEYKSIEEYRNELADSLVVEFHEVPLSEQELINIISLNNAADCIRQLAENSVNMAKATVYLIEGKDIRHERIDE